MMPLHYRRITDADLPALVALDSDVEVMRYINGGKTTPADVYRQVLPRWHRLSELGEHVGFFAIEDRPGGNFLGWVHNRPFEDQTVGTASGQMEVGYRLHRKQWGHGYASQAAQWVLAQNRAVGTGDTLVAIAMPENLGSIAVMRKLGMTFDRRYRHRTGVDVVKYRMTL